MSQRNAQTQHRRGRAWRVSLPLAAALAVVALALALPSPRAAPTGAGRRPATAQCRVAAAAPFTLASALPDGFSYQPYVVLDPSTSIGVATSSDLDTSRLVVRTADLAPRELRTLGRTQLSTVAAVTVAGDQVFWVETGENASGARATSVWRAGLRSGPARRLATDSSDIIYFDSAYDLQVGDGRVHWAAARGAAGHVVGEQRARRRGAAEPRQR